jgi:hypothetical protein
VSVTAAIALGAGAGLDAQGFLDKLRKQAEEAKRAAECAINPAKCPPSPGQKPSPKPGQQPVAASDPGNGVEVAPPIQITPAVTVLAPASTADRRAFTISPDGLHAAGLVTQGSRTAVMVDGTVGQAYDQIVISASPAIEFAPRGGRAAYVAKRGGSVVAVVGGRESEPFSAIQPHTTVPGAPPFSFSFSKDGSRSAFIGRHDGKGAPELYAVVDNVTGPRTGMIQPNAALFAGTRFAYVAMKSMQEAGFVVVVDGTAGPVFRGVSHLAGNQDGHVAYVGQEGQMWSVVVDGKVVRTHQRPDEEFGGILALAPAGNSVAYLLSRRQKGSEQVLMLNAEEVVRAPAVHQVMFSPDGKRWAAIVGELGDDGRPTGSTFVQAGSFRSQTYTNIRDLVFSPDSRRLAFVAQNGLQHFVVVDGKESQGYNLVENFQFSPDGSRHAFEAALKAERRVVVDMVDQPVVRSIVRNTLTFSPDGRRFAYAAEQSMLDIRVFLDGKAQEGRFLQFQTRTARPTARGAVFSPDGSRVAMAVDRINGRAPGGVLVDGTVVARGQSFSMPAFSPDGKHFAFVAMLNQKWYLVLDGRAMPLEGQPIDEPWTLHFVNDGLSVLRTRDGAIERVLLPLGS